MIYRARRDNAWGVSVRGTIYRARERRARRDHAWGMSGAIYSALIISALLASCSTSKVGTNEPRAIKPVIDQAMDLLGTSYCYAGTTPDCFDCSGFVGYCFRVVGVKLPRISSDIYAVGSAVSRSELQGGDLVFFTNENGVINHVGIALNKMQFIHSSTSKGVSIAPLSDKYWSPRYKGARRISPNASK